MRCGRCRHVFNGYETVSVGPDIPEPDAGGAPGGRFANAWWRRLLPGRRAARAEAPPARAMAGNAAIRAEGLTKMVELVRGGPDPASVEPGALRIRPAFGIEFERAADDFSTPGALLRRRLLRLGVVLAIACVPLLIFLARNAIVQAVPSLRPLYVAVCEPLHCAVPLPADPDAWSVESNELLEDQGTPQLYHFTATLRNRSRYTQGFPALDLSLTDVEGLAVDRRVVPPEQYLPPNRPTADGLTPNSEVAIRVDVKAADRRSQGYRVVLFFP